MLDIIIVSIFILGTFGSLFYIYKKTNFEQECDIMAKKITKEFIIEITEKMLNGAKYKMETEQDKKIYVNDIARVQDMVKKLQPLYYLY